METPKKIPYISGNRTFFIFKEKGTLKKVFIFQKTELFYISGDPKTKISYVSPKNVMKIFFIKTILDNSFYLLQKLSQTILLVQKNIEGFLLC